MNSIVNREKGTKMQEDETMRGEEINLDDLDAVAGGKTVTVHGNGATVECDIYCPKCRSRDIAGVDIHEFSNSFDFNSFLKNTNLMCNDCHFFGKGTKFRHKLV